MIGLSYVKEIVVGVIVLLLTTGGVYLYRGVKASGYNKCALENADLVVKNEDDMRTLRAQHLAVIDAFQKQLNQTRRQDDAKIQKLLTENTVLKAWWNTPVPGDAADFAYGLPDPAGDGPVRGGRDTLFGTTPWGAP